MKIEIKETVNLPEEMLLDLYKANGWSAADKPDLLLKALQNSHTLISAWDGPQLVGLGNAISDGFLVVYFPHLLVHPDYQGRGIGTLIMNKMHSKYQGFHQQMLTADGRAVDFYKKSGFEIAGKTQSMWIYKGKDH